MKHIMIIIVLCAVWTLVGFSEPPKQKDDAKVKSPLEGRLIVTQSKIKTNEHFELKLELKNVGKASLAVQSENPISFTVTITDKNGGVVKATHVVIDLLSSPQWAVVPRNCTILIPVSATGEDAHLNIHTMDWKLPAGKYKISAVYNSESFTEFKDKPNQVELWKGKLELAPIEVEITPEK